MGRTKASSGLSTEEYGLILRHFEEHGPEKVEEEMCIPHKEDKLPQELVLWATNHSSPCCIHGCLAPCARTARTTRMCCTPSAALLCNLLLHSVCSFVRVFL